MRAPIPDPNCSVIKYAFWVYPNSHCGHKCILIIEAATQEWSLCSSASFLFFSHAQIALPIFITNAQLATRLQVAISMLITYENALIFIISNLIALWTAVHRPLHFGAYYNHSLMPNFLLKWYPNGYECTMVILDQFIISINPIRPPIIRNMHHFSEFISFKHFRIARLCVLMLRLTQRAYGTFYAPPGTRLLVRNARWFNAHSTISKCANDWVIGCYALVHAIFQFANFVQFH